MIGMPPDEVNYRRHAWLTAHLADANVSSPESCYIRTHCCRGASMSRGTDVLIVGGGIIGLAVARVAARAGLSVRLFERDDAGGEASGAAAGMLGAQIDLEPFDPGRSSI